MPNASLCTHPTISGTSIPDLDQLLAHRAGRVHPRLRDQRRDEVGRRVVDGRVQRRQRCGCTPLRQRRRRLG